MARAPAAAPAAGAAGSNYPVIKDKAANQAATDYALKLAEVKRLEKELKPLKEKILAAMGGAPEAAFGTHIVSATQVAEIPAKPNVQIDKSMIGQIIKGAPGRAGYVQIRVQ